MVNEWFWFNKLSLILSMEGDPVFALIVVTRVAVVDCVILTARERFPYDCVKSTVVVETKNKSTVGQNAEGVNGGKGVDSAVRLVYSRDMQLMCFFCILIETRRRYFDLTEPVVYFSMRTFGRTGKCNQSTVECRDCCLRGCAWSG